MDVRARTRLAKLSRRLFEDQAGLDQPQPDELARQILTDIVRQSESAVSKVSTHRVGDVVICDASLGAPEQEVSGNSGVSEFPISIAVSKDSIDVTLNGQPCCSIMRGMDDYAEKQQHIVQAIQQARIAVTDQNVNPNQPNYAGLSRFGSMY